MNANFLLKTEVARKLYFDHAAKMPIFDFHCHLSPQVVYENNRFKDITEAWLGGDHYKWRLMRSVGIEEKYITGDGDGLSKFKAFAKALRCSIGNPLYHWAHLELQRYFDIYEPLTEDNAEAIYHKVNALLAGEGFRVRDFIKKSKVSIIFTTDDPSDSLEYHIKIKEDTSFETKLIPAFRPDKCLNLNADFPAYIQTLGKAAGMSIDSLQDLKEALLKRIDFFHSLGCRASDHAFVYIPFVKGMEDEVAAVFKKALKAEPVSASETDLYKTYLMRFLAAEYQKRDWAMEIHYGVLRNNNGRMFQKLGPDTGYDTIADGPNAQNLSQLLNAMEETGSLPKTILFNANPVDNYLLASMAGCFQSAEAQCKIQLGTAWWFNDHIDGMEAQMKALANDSTLGRFIGMLTDSRSFLSYPRHEYFRRILCNLLGTWIEEGHYPNDKFVGQMVEDICYNNAIRYFGQ